MNDEIFLLSIEEYKKYHDRIPHINCWWWLRSPGDYSDFTAGVDDDGSIYFDGYRVDYDDGAVRPVLRIAHPEKIGMRIVQYDFPWIVIDKNLAIAEVPIVFHRFDNKSNNYENSEIKKFLNDWIERR